MNKLTAEEAMGLMKAGAVLVEDGIYRYRFMNGLYEGSFHIGIWGIVDQHRHWSGTYAIDFSEVTLNEIQEYINK
jgi:hypothetical protein